MAYLVNRFSSVNAPTRLTCKQLQRSHVSIIVLYFHCIGGRTSCRGRGDEDRLQASQPSSRARQPKEVDVRVDERVRERCRWNDRRSLPQVRLRPPYRLHRSHRRPPPQSNSRSPVRVHIILDHALRVRQESEPYEHSRYAEQNRICYLLDRPWMAVCRLDCGQGQARRFRGAHVVPKIERPPSEERTCAIDCLPKLAPTHVPRFRPVPPIFRLFQSVEARHSWLVSACEKRVISAEVSIANNWGSYAVQVDDRFHCSQFHFAGAGDCPGR
jgi:hypothetical protein